MTIRLDGLDLLAERTRRTRSFLAGEAIAGYAYIAERNPAAAARVANRINQAARNIAAMPTGRRGRVSGTCEKPISGLPYIIACAIEATEAGDEAVAVLRAVHGGRNWRVGTWPE